MYYFVEIFHGCFHLFYEDNIILIPMSSRNICMKRPWIEWTAVVDCVYRNLKKKRELLSALEGSCCLLEILFCFHESNWHKWKQKTICIFDQVSWNKWVASYLHFMRKYILSDLLRLLFTLLCVLLTVQFHLNSFFWWMLKNWIHQSVPPRVGSVVIALNKWRGVHHGRHQTTESNLCQETSWFLVFFSSRCLLFLLYFYVWVLPQSQCVHSNLSTCLVLTDFIEVRATEFPKLFIFIITGPSK